MSEKKKNKEIVRIGFRTTEDVRDFYKEEAEKFGMGYTTYIGVILVQHYLSTKEKREAMESLSVLKTIDFEETDPLMISDTLKNIAGLIEEQTKNV